MSKAWGIWCLNTEGWMRDVTGHPDYNWFDCTYPTRAAAMADLKDTVLPKHVKDYEIRKYRRAE